MILTQKSTKILGIVAAVLVFALGVFLVIMPALDTFGANNESIAQAESEVSLMQSQRDGFLQAQAMYPQLQQIDEDLRVRFPEIADNEAIIVQLSDALIQSGIESSSLTLTFSAPVIMTPVFEAPAAPPAPAEGEEVPAEEAPAEEVPAEAPPVDAAAGGGMNDMAKMDVSIAVEGTNEQLVTFLNVLHSAERAIVVKGYSATLAELTQLSLQTEVFIFARIPNPGIQTEPATVVEGEEVTVEETVVEPTA